jgi:hypothetical protein
MTGIDDFFKSVEGDEVPGGCGQCHAIQRMTEVEPRVWSIIVAHDDDCPTLRAKKAKSN